MRFLSLLIGGTGVAFSILAANPVVHPLFTSNMVLQRDAADPVWGWAPAGTNMTVVVKDQNGVPIQTNTTVAGLDGRWQVNVGPFGLVPNNAAYTMIISTPGETTVTLTNVLIGDVLLCAGQSNMAFSLNVIGVTNLAQEIADSANYPLVRCFTVPNVEAVALTNCFSGGSWQIAGPSTTGNFTATGYFTAREIYKQQHVPIGILCSAWPGTEIECWVNSEFASSISDFTQPVFDQTLQSSVRSVVSYLYNAMIYPLVPFRIKAVEWYQGEYNTANPEQYRRLLPGLVNDWRTLWGQPDLPFIIIQLPNFGGAQTQPVEAGSWAELREAQLKTVLNDPNSRLVTTIDIGGGLLHPIDKQDVGLRAAWAAANLIYGQNVLNEGPLLSGKTVSGNSIICTFTNVGRGLMIGAKTLSPLSPVQQVSGGLTNFAICGANKVYYAANAVITAANQVTVSSSSVSAPVAVRYGWGNNPPCNLYSEVTDGNGNATNGVPAPPFRTDPVNKLMVNYGTGTGYYASNTVVSVTASNFTAETFDHWSGDTNLIANLNTTSTTVTQAQEYVSILANYRLTGTISGLATATQPGQIALSWNPLNGVHYLVYRSTTSGGPYSLVATQSPDSQTNYTDLNVTPGTTYYYVVVPTNLLGAGATSLQVSASTSPNTTNTWDTNGATSPNPSDGSGQWLGGNNWWTGSANIAGTWTGTAVDSAIIGAGTSGTYTIDLGASSLSMSNILFATSGYTLTNGTLTVVGPGTTVNTNVTATVNATMAAGPITVNSGGSLTLGAGGSLANANGLGSLQFASLSTKSVTTANGVLDLGTPDTLTGGVVISDNTAFSASGTLGIGDRFGSLSGVGLLVVNSPTASVNNSSTGIVVGRRNTAAVGRLVVKAGSVNATAGIAVVENAGCTGEIDVWGGTLNCTPTLTLYNNNGSGGTATFQITNGLVSMGTTGTFSFGNTSATGGAAILAMSGGSFYPGSGGIIVQGTVTTSLTLSGGTVGANANWSSVLDMMLTNTGGNITFQAADTNGVARNISLSGALSGVGGLTKTGGGTLTLSGANTYSGTTVVNAGILALTGVNGGTGDYLVANNATLSLQTTGSGSSQTMTSLTLNGGSVLNLNINSTGLPSAPAINVTGAVTPSSPVVLNLSFSGSGLTNGEFPIIKYGSLGGAGFGAFALGSVALPSGVNGMVSLVNNTADKSIDLSFTTYSAADLVWDANTNISGAQDGSGVWNSTTTNWWNGTTDMVWGSGSNAIFGFSQDGSYSVTLGGTMTVSNLNFNMSGYSLSGGEVYLLPGGGVEVAGGKTATVNSIIGDNNNSVISFTANTGGSLNLGGGFASSPQGSFYGAGAINITGGTYPFVISRFNGATVSQTGGTVNLSGNGGVGNWINYGAGQNVNYTINGGSLNLNGAGAGAYLGLGRNSGNTTGTLTVRAGGTVNIGTNSPGQINIAHDNSSNGKLDVQGGVLTVGTGSITNQIYLFPGGANSGESAVMTEEGGMVTAQGIQFGAASGSYSAGTVASLTLTGGSLYLGSLGLNEGANHATDSVTFSGGTVGAVADWSSAMNIDLGSGGGPVTIQAANANGTAHNITLTGLLSDSQGFIKTGAGTLLLSQTNTFFGSISVNNGTLSFNVRAADDGSSGSLGASLAPGRTITINSGATLSGTINNWFGAGSTLIPDANLPSIIINGGTVTSTRYTSLGNVTLNSGATLIQSVSDSGNFEGYQFRGTITVGGASPSIISSGNDKADHLSTNTVFNVSDVTGDAGVDLTVSVNLRNQSGDNGLATGGLTKAGSGTMWLGGANTYTGGTTINGGTLVLATTNNVSMAYTNTGGTLQVQVAANGISLPMNSLTCGSNAPQLTFDLNNTFGLTAPIINDAGNLVLNGNVLVNVLNPTAGTNTLLQCSGTRSGNGSFVAGTVPNGATIVDDTANNRVELIYSPKPRVMVPALNTNEVVVAAATPQEYGAKGDGITDDSAAFQRTINAVYNSGHFGGGVIYVPAGNYAFYTNLALPTGVTIHGDWMDWAKTGGPLVGTTFKVYFGAGQTNAAAFIYLNRSTALKGVNIWYPNQDPNNITGYPFSISVAGGKCAVMNVALVNSYAGIQSFGGAQHVLSTIVGTPLFVGIWVDNQADVSQTEDVWFSPGVWAESGLSNAPTAGGAYATWMRANGEGMEIFRADGESSMNTYISGYKVGIEANSSTNGASGDSFYNGCVSNCATALLAQQMEGQSGMEFTRFTLDGDTAVNRTTNSSDATIGFDHCQIIGRSGTAVNMTGVDWHSWVAFQDCTISNTLNQAGPGVLNLVNCTVQGPTQCVMSASATRVAFTGCTFTSPSKIVNFGNASNLLMDARQSISNTLPMIDWTNVVNDYVSRRPARTNLFVATAYGATGDGTHDDTAAIQSALTAAGDNGGGIVYLPGGKYHLTNTLDVPSGVELRGPFELRHYPWPAPDNYVKGAVLEPYEGQGATNGPVAIALEASSGLVGVTISYETQNTNCIPFPPAIQGRGGNVYVTAVVCPNPYCYVDMDTYTCTNHLIYLVDGWALDRGYVIGSSSSGSIVDCHCNWTYWWDNYGSASDLSSAWRPPVRTFAEENLAMYTLGDCTELMLKDFSIAENRFLHCVAENGKGPNVTGISSGCDGTVQGYVLDAAAPCAINFINDSWTADYTSQTNYLTNDTVAVTSTTNFEGTARFFNTPVFGGPKWDYNVNGGDVGFELVHMLDHSELGSVVNGGVLHLVNCGAYISYNGPTRFPPYNITFGTNAGMVGKVSEFIGCYAYNGCTYTNWNTNNPVNVWQDYALYTYALLSETNQSYEYAVTAPLLSLQSDLLAHGLILQWPDNGVGFNLYYTPNLTPPIAWTMVTNAPVYSNGQWIVTLPLGPNQCGYYCLHQ